MVRVKTCLSADLIMCLSPADALTVSSSNIWGWQFIITPCRRESLNFHSITQDAANATLHLPALTSCMKNHLAQRNKERAAGDKTGTLKNACVGTRSGGTSGLQGADNFVT